MTIRFPLIPRKLRYSIVLLVCFVIFYFSVLTVPPKTPKLGPFQDKKLHFIVYGILALFLVYSIVRLQKRPILCIAIILSIILGYEITIELLQVTIPYVYFSINDILANIFGGLIGITWILVERYIEYRKTKITEIMTVVRQKIGCFFKSIKKYKKPRR